MLTHMRSNPWIFEYMWRYTYGQNFPLEFSALLTLINWHFQCALIASQDCIFIHGFAVSISCKMTLRDVPPQREM